MLGRKLDCGAALVRGNREAFARVPRQRTSLTHVEARFTTIWNVPSGQPVAVCFLTSGKSEGTTAIPLSVRQMDSPEIDG